MLAPAGAERKNMPNILAEQYAGVLAHLEREIAEIEQKLSSLQAEMIQVQANRNGLLKLVAELEKRRDLAVLAPPPSVSGFVIRQTSPAPPAELGPFSNLSMRWAILQLLGEFSPDIPLINEDIANRLRDGGFNTGTPLKFRANVNSVLSRMAAQNEVTKSGEAGYILTAFGRAEWLGIKKSEKFTSRHNAGPSNMFSEEDSEAEGTNPVPGADL
jgi:hypothetical protein